MSGFREMIFIYALTAFAVLIAFLKYKKEARAWTAPELEMAAPPDRTVVLSASKVHLLRWRGWPNFVLVAVGAQIGFFGTMIAGYEGKFRLLVAVLGGLAGYLVSLGAHETQIPDSRVEERTRGREIIIEPGLMKLSRAIVHPHMSGPRDNDDYFFVTIDPRCTIKVHLRSATKARPYFSYEFEADNRKLSLAAVLNPRDEKIFLAALKSQGARLDLNPAKSNRHYFVP